MAKAGGGGGSGKIGYPAYVETVHNDWLDNTGVDTISSSVTDIMNAALVASPWAAAVAYDPAVDITAWEAVVAAFAAILAALNDTTDWDALYTQAETSIGNLTDVANITDTTDVTGITEAEIVADVDAFADQLDDEITTKILPRYRSGMLNVNAVHSSAFPLGQSVIEGFRNREVAKHNSEIRLMAAAKNADIELENEKLHLEVKKVNANIDITNNQLDLEDRKLYLQGADQMLRLMIQRISWEEGYVRTYLEAKRMRIVANKEEADVNLTIGEKDAKWDLEVFQYGANLLAAPGGGTASPGGGPSTLQSALGGALSGAAAGAMIAPAMPAAPIIGAALGLASGLI